MGSNGAPADQETTEAPEGDIGGDGGRRETRAQRADRNFHELLQELRVLQTGVQILLGFLLVLSVEPRFVDLSGTAHGVYVVTLVLCCIASGLLMAPVAYHRTLFARGRKPEIVRVTNRFLRTGMAAMFLTVLGAALLVLSMVLDNRLAAGITGAIGGTFAFIWYAFPWYRRTHPAP